MNTYNHTHSMLKRKFPFQICCIPIVSTSFTESGSHICVCVCVYSASCYIFLLFIVQYHKCFFVNSKKKKIFSFHWILQSETIKCFRHAIIYEMSSSRAQEPNLITSFSFFPLSLYFCCCCCFGFKSTSDMSSDNAKKCP